MAFERIERVETLEASADLSAKQFYIVKMSTTRKIDVCDSAAAAHGVLQDKPKSGEDGNVAVCGAGGITRLVVDGSGTAIAAGDYIKSNASGKGIKGAVDKDRVIGKALEAATADGIIIAVDLAYARDLAA
jgi:hypothetical protein